MGKDGEYESRMREAMEQFFSEEPYTSLRNRFNVYTVKAISKKFVEFDTPAREAYIQQRNARQRAKAQKVQDRRIESRPPTIYKGTWRDAGDKQKNVYQKYLEK